MIQSKCQGLYGHDSSRFATFRTFLYILPGVGRADFLRRWGLFDTSVGCFVDVTAFKEASERTKCFQSKK
jgi:hypothetical protein